MDGILAAVGGAVTGLALGLTGGGGTMLAVPLLRHGVGMPLEAATVVSLAAVAALSAVGGIGGIRRGEAKPMLAAMFAAAGWPGAPLGAWMHALLPQAVIVAALVIVIASVAVRMWRGTADPALRTLPAEAAAPACRFGGDGRLDLASRCGRSLALTGLLVGVLSGLIGVGGGFLVVPALLRLSGMPMRAAVATSLLVVALVSLAALGAHLALGHRGPALPGATFVAGGLVGLAAAAAVASRLPQTLLRRIFAAILVLVAVAELAAALVPALVTVNGATP